MKSQIKLVCPVSAQIAAMPYADDEEGTFVPYEGDDDIDLPVGWGRLVLDVVAPNPEIGEATRARELEVKAAMKQIQAMVKDESVPEAQRKMVADELKSGKAKKEVEAQPAERIPIPTEGTVVLRLAFPVLGSEAVGAALKALRDAGFPIVEAKE